MYKKAAELELPGLNQITSVKMDSTPKHTITRIILIHTCLSIILGWFTPLVLTSLGHPLRFGHGHGKVAVGLGRNVSQSIEEYRNQSLAFPEPNVLALLSDRAKLLEYSASLLESPTSEKLAGGLRDASTALERFWPDLIGFQAFNNEEIYRLNTISRWENYTYAYELNTKTGREHTATIAQTINDMKNRIAGLQTVLVDMGSAMTTISKSLRIEKAFLENDQKDAGGVMYLIKRLSMIWRGVAEPRSDGRWEQDVLDRCQSVVYEMNSIGLVSGFTVSRLNSTIHEIESFVSTIVSHSNLVV
jgi:hypothetical protein